MKKALLLVVCSAFVFNSSQAYKKRTPGERGVPPAPAEGQEKTMVEEKEPREWFHRRAWGGLKHRWGKFRESVGRHRRGLFVGAATLAVLASAYAYAVWTGNDAEIKRILSEVPANAREQFERLARAAFARLEGTRYYLSKIDWSKYKPSMPSMEKVKGLLPLGKTPETPATQEFFPGFSPFE